MVRPFGRTDAMAKPTLTLSCVCIYTPAAALAMARKVQFTSSSRGRPSSTTYDAVDAPAPPYARHLEAPEGARMSSSSGASTAAGRTGLLLASSGAAAAAAVAVLLVAAAAAGGASASPAAGLQCMQVAQLMTPCMPYLTGVPGMTTPYGICCNSLGVLNQLAATPADRVAACNCVKAAAGGFPSVDFARAAGLPASCGLSISFTISPNMDCTQVTEEP